MIDVIDFSSWKEYDGASEGSGRSEKIWLKSDNGQIGLFKFPKIDPVDNKETTEHISEHLAHKIGETIGVLTAKVDIGTYNGRIGSMSYFVCEENEFLKEGIWFLSAKFPKYDIEKMKDEESGKYYCLEHLFGAASNWLSNRVHIEMMLFDFLIGNSDRHQSNWAILIGAKMEKGLSISIRQCPLYDNGSSLCCYVNREKVSELLGNDKNRFDALVDSKSKSRIRIDGNKKRLPSHREMIEHLFKNYSVSKEIARDFLSHISAEIINSLIAEYPNEILSADKKILINKFLINKINILEELLKEYDKHDSKK
ncbi:MAG: protein kinase [Ruminiclostridium sp.]|nr:protein kinase [Ruminiclostridium sp.]